MKKTTKKTAKKAPTKAMKQIFEAAVEEAIPQEPRLARTMPPEPVIEDVEDGDLYEPYAPKAGEVPLAAGETQETAPQPGDWSAINTESRASIPESTEQPFRAEELEEPAPAVKQPESSEIGQWPLESLEMPLESSDPLFGDVTPEHLRKWLRLAAEAIQWLAKRDRRLQPKDKGILDARIQQLAKIRSQIP